MGLFKRFSGKGTEAESDLPTDNNSGEDSDSTPIENELEKLIETSVTLDYQSDIWGIKRIAEDGVQNHLPSDSYGTRVDVEFLIDEQWVSYSQRATVGSSKVNAVRFSDDGKGFSYDLLGVFYSTKRNERESVGQFGEGIKMLSAACLREGIDLEIRSRDWLAKPVVRDLNIDGQEVRQMCYEVYNHQDDMQGSMTIFKNPSRQFIDYVFQLDKTVLELAEDKNGRIFQTSDGAILESEGQIYVKGIHITDDFREKLLFGYDIIADTNRDRNMVNPNILNNQIGAIVRKLDDPKLIETILTATTEGKNYMEFDALYWDKSAGGGGSGGLRLQHPDLWRDVFYDLFGQKAVLTAVGGRGESSKLESADKLARIAGYKVIKMSHRDMVDMLEGCGVETSESIKADENARLLQGENYNPDNIEVRIAETSLTAQYRARKWDTQRIILDTLANHMPNDSGGSSIDIEYYVTSNRMEGGKWISRSEKGLLHDVQAVRFRDDGKGYSSKFLELLYSTKDDSQSVGQFGEGLKMLCNAFLRYKDGNTDKDLKLRSRDWVAMPFSSDVRLDGTQTERLNYRIAEGLEDTVGSMTIIYQPSLEMVRIVDSIQQLVLAFNQDYRPLSQSEEGTVLSGEKYGATNKIKKGSVFVRDFYITNEFKPNLLFSYNLTSQNINPDRDMMDNSYVRSAVRDVISNCDNPNVIVEIVRNAIDNEQDIFEFQTLSFTGDNKHIGELYMTIFQSMFGEKAVLYTDDPYTFATAKHWGYEPVKVNRGMRQTLRNAGVITDSEVVKEGFNADYVSLDELTEDEKSTLGKYQEVDQCLGVESAETPRVYTKVLAKNGEELPYPGFFDGQVHVRRDQLKDLFTFVSTYKHEKGHEVTGASDPEDRFRDFFEKRLTQYIISDIQGKK
jgi:hypothetical protein